MIITLTIFLFLCGIAGFILNRNNVILLIVAIELMLLAVALINSCFTPSKGDSTPKEHCDASLTTNSTECRQGCFALLRSKICGKEGN